MRKWLTVDVSLADRTVMEPGDTAPPDRSSTEYQLKTADNAQRALAEIWSSAPVGGPEDDSLVADEELAMLADPGPITPLAPETGEAQMGLGIAHLEAGETAAAIPLLEAAIDSFEPAGAEDASQLALARGALARAYLAARRPQMAIALYDSLLSGSAGASTESQLAEYRIKRAAAHRATGNVTAAIAQLEGLVAELRTSGQDDERLLEAQVELGTTHVVAGRPRDGAAAYEEALPLADAVHGAGHRYTLSIRIFLARAYRQAAQTQLAIRTYESVISTAETALGSADKLTEAARGELAMLPGAGNR
jgi:tetratricopeptide (TPR) repeat protein